MYHTTLRQYFGYEELKPVQHEAVCHLLARRDVLAVLPTGTGKSLIYQLTGLMLPHLTIVITPLLALMFDQVHQLQARGIAAASWNCLTPPAMKQQLLRRLRAGELKFLYLSPEKLRSPMVSAVLQKQVISQLCIDEAHCVTQWADEFRPQYGHLGDWLSWYQQSQPRPLVSAFTATTTVTGANDIIARLQLREPALVSLPCWRENLRYQIIPVPSENWKRQIMKHILQVWKAQLDGLVIVYAATRLDVVWIAWWLQDHGFPHTRFFHAGLTQTEKDEVMQLLHQGKRCILVATNAFGLGIDLPKVRLVIHHSPPASLAAFVQEAGRAGRNGQEAFSVVLWHEQQWLENLDFFLQGDSKDVRQRKWKEARAMWQFLRRRECLSRQIVRYFRLPSTPRCSLHECGCMYCRQNFPWNPENFRSGAQQKNYFANRVKTSGAPSVT